MNTITLTRGANCWMATHSGPYGEHVLEAFGTKTIPTPYRLDVPAEQVRREIAARNPAQTVIVT